MPRATNEEQRTNNARNAFDLRDMDDASDEEASTQPTHPGTMSFDTPPAGYPHTYSYPHEQRTFGEVRYNPAGGHVIFAQPQTVSIHGKLFSICKVRDRVTRKQL